MEGDGVKSTPKLLKMAVKMKKKRSHCLFEWKEIKLHKLSVSK